MPTLCGDPVLAQPCGWMTNPMAATVRVLAKRQAASHLECMTLPAAARFRSSLSDPEPPPTLSPPLRALWFDANGNWPRAHAEVEDGATPQACQVHGYLHRKEGDRGNAAYWYRRARVPVADGPLEGEWDALLDQLLTG
jgi:hypothetical protein